MKQVMHMYDNDVLEFDPQTEFYDPDYYDDPLYGEDHPGGD